jgi:hypothetical protein
LYANKTPPAIAAEGVCSVRADKEDLGFLLLRGAEGFVAPAAVFANVSHSLDDAGLAFAPGMDL